MTNNKILFLLMFVGLGLVSCQQLTESIQETLHPVPLATKEAKQRSSKLGKLEDIKPGTSTYKGLFASAARLDSIQATLTQLPRLKGRFLKVYAHIVFYDFEGGWIKLQLQDPDAPTKVLVYNYHQHSGWEAPRPLEHAEGPEQMKLKLLPLDQLRFSVAKKVFDHAMSQVKNIKHPDTVKFINLFYYAQQKHPAKWTTTLWQKNRYVDYSFDLKGQLLKADKEM